MAAGPRDGTRHAGQVARRGLLGRNIAVDAETAQPVAAVVQAGAGTRPNSSKDLLPLTAEGHTL